MMYVYPDFEELTLQSREEKRSFFLVIVFFSLLPAVFYSCVLGHCLCDLLSPDVILCGWLGSKHQLTNFVTYVPAGSPSRGGDVAVYVFNINQPSLLTPFDSVLVSIRLYGSFNYISFDKFFRQLDLCFLTLFFRSYFYIIGPFKYIPLYESLLRPWYNSLWLTGLRAATITN